MLTLGIIPSTSINSIPTYSTTPSTSPMTVSTTWYPTPTCCDNCPCDSLTRGLPPEKWKKKYEYLDEKCQNLLGAYINLKREHARLKAICNH